MTALETYIGPICFDWKPTKELDIFVRDLYKEQKYGEMFTFRLHPRLDTTLTEFPPEITVDKIIYNTQPSIKRIYGKNPIKEAPTTIITYRIEFFEPITILFGRLPSLLNQPRKIENIHVLRPFFEYATEVQYNPEGIPQTLFSRAESKNTSLKLFTPEQPKPYTGEKNYQSIRELIIDLYELEILLKNIRIIGK